jgi:hypothetical protein
MGLQAHSLWKIDCERPEFIAIGSPNILDAFVDSIREAQIPAEQQPKEFA